MWPFFLAVFFHISLDRLRKKGTTRSLPSTTRSFCVTTNYLLSFILVKTEKRLCDELIAINTMQLLSLIRWQFEQFTINEKLMLYYEKQVERLLLFDLFSTKVFHCYFSSSMQLCIDAMCKHFIGAFYIEYILYTVWASYVHWNSECIFLVRKSGFWQLGFWLSDTIYGWEFMAKISPAYIIYLLLSLSTFLNCCSLAKKQQLKINIKYNCY